MNIFETFSARLATALAGMAQAGRIPAGLSLARVVVEPTRDPSHGDLATNAAMVLAKEAGMQPRALAELICAEIVRDADVLKAEIAGPGFINVTLQPAVFTAVLKAAVLAGSEHGRGAPKPAPKINVEYVSANPTGPMHVGHGRGAVFGDALASLLAFAGHDVTREYYINDAGAQVDVLARSAFLRYREALGEAIGAIPEGLYPGDYLVSVGQALAAEHGPALRAKSETEWLPLVRQAAVEAMLCSIMDDLRALGVRFDVFYSERSLLEGANFYRAPEGAPTFYFARQSYDITDGPSQGIRSYLAQASLAANAVPNVGSFSGVFSAGVASGDLGQPDFIASVISQLRSDDLIYEGRLPPPKGQKDEDWEDREQTLFRATQFGDDVDRPLLKSDGSYTYFANDIAYHRSKFTRGFAEMIDVWGADHGGYVKRMQAAVKAVTNGQGALDVKLCQLVRLLRHGEQVRMSKRSGDFVTLREVIDEVGRDAVRFMMIFRKNDATLDFDLAKVVEQSKDNPVFYVQYAHARCCSIFRQAAEAFPDLDRSPQALAEADLSLLHDESELAIIRMIAAYPRMIDAAAASHEPHRVAFFVHELASAFHSLWNKGKDSPQLRFVNQTDRKSTSARLAFVHAVRSVLASGLAVVGVTAPEEMR